ncbi:hypothetical protein [Streptomyces goshikiensis]|uniref:hypothetical protein n=1 Tax=Streptomyces goshikiensis TaxID=1942 RepID=UPI00365691C8
MSTLVDTSGGVEPTIRDVTAQDAGASEVGLQRIAAEGLQDVYFRDGGGRAQGLLVEFTDIDYIDVNL